MKTHFLSLLMLLLAGALHAQPADRLAYQYPADHLTLHLTQPDDFVALAPLAQFWADTSMQADIRQVHSRHESLFGPWPQNMPGWHSPYHYWIRIHCFNASAEEQSWMLHLGRADSARIWVVHESGLNEQAESGLFKVFEPGEWISRNGEAIMPLALPGRKAATIYACLSSRHGGVRLHPYLQARSEWENIQSSDLLLQQTMLALLLLVVAIGLPTAIWLRKASHLAFIAFAGCYSLWILHSFGYLRMHFWLDQPLLNWYAGAFAMLFAQPLYIWFVYEQLPQRPPILQVWVWVRMAFATVLAILLGSGLALPLEWATRSFWLFDALLVGYWWWSQRAEGSLAVKWTLAGGVWLYLCLVAGSLADHPDALRQSHGYPAYLYAFQIGLAGTFLAYCWSTFRYTANPYLQQRFQANLQGQA